MRGVAWAPITTGKTSLKMDRDEGKSPEKSESRDLMLSGVVRPCVCRIKWLPSAVRPLGGTELLSQGFPPKIRCCIRLNYGLQKGQQSECVKKTRQSGGDAKLGQKLFPPEWPSKRPTNLPVNRRPLERQMGASIFFVAEIGP